MDHTESKVNLDLPLYLFHQGTNFTAYDLLGVHGGKTENGEYEYTFRVWAPKAESVYVVGDFCRWEGGVSMVRISDAGVWEGKLRSSASLEGSFYKYSVTGGGRTVLKADPYARMNQTLTNTASVIRTNIQYRWGDAEWIRKRKKIMGTGTKKKSPHFCPSPINIYEMHLGSWRTVDGESTEDGQHYLNYRETADMLLPYLLEMGFTHVELMPVMEHPFDGSWGYQICGYYSPTARYGTPEDFMYFVDTLHRNNIGVILDWVPAHFPKDAHGLYEFDGSPLYEYQGQDRMEHAGWGTRCFDVGRTEVQSFLVSNALFWFREYHVDGLRVDAVASMLYLDFDREPGRWIPNVYGGNQNLEAIAFFQKLNRAVFAEFPDVFMIAEESTAWPMITKPADDGGLGFNFKWNMGWANDMFEYVQTDPLFRSGQHAKLTFPLMYAFSENYILPVSHDEVVHGKKSLIEKMHGEYEDKFGCMRAFLASMMTLPGKKLMFMGTEFGQFREWDYARSLEWFLLEYSAHRKMKAYTAALNHFYLSHSELWEIDDSWDGFQWIDADNASESVVSYRRINKKRQEIIVVISFTPVRRDGFCVEVPRAGEYEEVFAGDLEEFGGGGTVNGCVRAVLEKTEEKGKKYYLRFTLPPYGVVFWKKRSPKNNHCEV